MSRFRLYELCSNRDHDRVQCDLLHRHRTYFRNYIHLSNSRYRRRGQSQQLLEHGIGYYIGAAYLPTSNYERGERRWDGGYGIFVSDHGNEFADQLRSGEFAGGFIGQHGDGLNFRNPDDGGHVLGELERDQQRGNGDGDTDVDHQ